MSVKSGQIWEKEVFMKSGEYAGHFWEHNVTHSHYILLCMGHNSAKLDKIAELKASMGNLKIVSNMSGHDLKTKVLSVIEGWPLLESLQ